MEEIKTCSFCRCDAPEERAIFQEKLTLCAPYQVVCSCGARGMHGDTKEKAIKNWNIGVSHAL